MKLYLKDGKSIEGTEEEIATLLTVTDGEVLSLVSDFNEYGNEHVYKSESKGFVIISKMESLHIKNAILKIYREWVERFHTDDNFKDLYRFVDTVKHGPASATFMAMLTELRKRTYDYFGSKKETTWEIKCPRK